MHRFPFIKYRLILVFVNLFRFFSFRSNSRLKNNFFILGSGRNGSTLLASILNAHHNLFIPPEQFVLPYVIMKRYLCFQRKKKRKYSLKILLLALIIHFLVMRIPTCWFFQKMKMKL